MVDEPHDHHRPEEPPDRAGAALLDREEAEEDRAA